MEGGGQQVRLYPNMGREGEGKTKPEGERGQKEKVGGAKHLVEINLLFFWPLYCWDFFFCLVTLGGRSLEAGGRQTDRQEDRQTGRQTDR